MGSFLQYCLIPTTPPYVHESKRPYCWLPATSKCPSIEECNVILKEIHHTVIVKGHPCKFKDIKIKLIGDDHLVKSVLVFHRLRL